MGRSGGPHGDHVPLSAARGADRLDTVRRDPDVLHLGVRGRAVQAAGALRQGQEAAVGRGHPHRLVAGPRPGESPRDRRPADPDLRLGALGQDDGQGEGPPATPPAGADPLAVHARRAGCADGRRPDRPDRPRSGREVLCGHAGDGRGAPRGGVRAAAEREAWHRLPDHAGAQVAPGDGADRPALGHDLSRHADPHRGPRPGRLPAHPRLRQEPPGRLRQRLRDAGRGTPRRLRAARATRLLPASRPATTCGIASTRRSCGRTSACR